MKFENLADAALMSPGLSKIDNYNSEDMFGETELLDI